jgi:uncharacterized protein YyaL (SSP411 family)
VAGPSAGVLDDYGCVADGLLVLAGVTGEARWAQLAGQLLDTALDRFGDQGGGFYDTADDGEALLYRPADPADGPSPSGTFAVAGALLGYAALTGSQRHRAAARAALSPLAAIAGRFPSAAGAGLTVAAALLSGPAEIAVVGPPGDPRTAELHRAALHAAPPGAVLALGHLPANDGAGPAGQADQAKARGGAAGGQADEEERGGAAAPRGGGSAEDAIPLLAGRGLVGGAPAAYVCRDFTCRLPVTDPDELRQVLASGW